MKKRLDLWLMEQGIVTDGRNAFILVTEGKVFVNGQRAVSPAQVVSQRDYIEVRKGREFVGRGAYKLEGALTTFNIDCRGKVVLDVGSATGGFVEVLLLHGAAKVYALDAGHGKLALKLREDPRVVVMENTNIISLPVLPEKVAVVTIDVSLTSLKQVLPKIREYVTSDGEVVALFKPHYEIRDKSFLKHGILRDSHVRDRSIEGFRAWIREHHWQELAMTKSPIRGTEGNIEYLFHLKPLW